MDMSFSRVPMALTRRRHFRDLCPEEALTEGSPALILRGNASTQAHPRMIFLLVVRGKVRSLVHHSLSLMRTAEGMEQTKLGQELRRLGAWEASVRACLQG